MNSVNLIPIARQLRDSRGARLKRWSLAVGGTVCILAGAGGLLRASESRSASIDTTQCARLETEIAEKTKASNQLRSEIQLLDRQIQAGRQVTEHPDYSILLALLSQTAGTKIILKHCAIDRPQHEGEIPKSIAPTLQLRGNGASQSAVTSFVLRLEATGVFDQVTLLRSNEQSDAGGSATTFQLECLFDAAGRGTP